MARGPGGMGLRMEGLCGNTLACGWATERCHVLLSVRVCVSGELGCVCSSWWGTREEEEAGGRERRIIAVQTAVQDRDGDGEREERLPQQNSRQQPQRE